MRHSDTPDKTAFRANLAQHQNVAEPSRLLAGKMPALLSEGSVAVPAAYACGQYARAPFLKGAWPSRPHMLAGKMPALLSAEGSVAVPAAYACGQDARAPFSRRERGRPGRICSRARCPRSFPEGSVAVPAAYACGQDAPLLSDPRNSRRLTLNLWHKNCYYPAVI
jgi:hypothetical protein